MVALYLNTNTFRVKQWDQFSDSSTFPEKCYYFLLKQCVTESILTLLEHSTKAAADTTLQQHTAFELNNVGANGFYWTITQAYGKEVSHILSTQFWISRALYPKALSIC